MHLFGIGDQWIEDQYLWTNTLIAPGEGVSLLSKGRASYMCFYTQVGTHTCKYIHIYTFLHAYKHTRMHTHKYTYFGKYKFMPKPLSPNCPQRMFSYFPKSSPVYVSLLPNYINTFSNLAQFHRTSTIFQKYFTWTS